MIITIVIILIMIIIVEIVLCSPKNSSPLVYQVLPLIELFFFSCKFDLARNLHSVCYHLSSISVVHIQTFSLYCIPSPLTLSLFSLYIVRVMHFVLFFLLCPLCWPLSLFYSCNLLLLNTITRGVHDLQASLHSGPLRFQLNINKLF